MIFARFDTEALTRVRFAISPMLEVARSIRALDDPAGRALHIPWAERARPLVADLDLSLLRAVSRWPVLVRQARSRSLRAQNRDRKSTRLNSSHTIQYRMPSSA